MSHRTPLPRGMPRPMRLPVFDAPPRPLGPPRPIPLLLVFVPALPIPPLPLPAGPPRAPLALGVADDPGTELYLLAFTVGGGLSTKLVSVVRNVASVSGIPVPPV
jgi:hypothetical protein